MSCALRSRESSARRLISDSAVGEIVVERGTTKVVTWILGNKDMGDLGGKKGFLSTLTGFGARIGILSLPITVRELGRSSVAVDLIVGLCVRKAGSRAGRAGAGAGTGTASPWMGRAAWRWEFNRAVI